jgi:sensor domain CHASE-containing protein
MTKALATKPIFIKLSVLGVVAVGMILWSLFWLTGRINEIEREATRDLVELMVTETVDRVQASTNDYAFWSLAYEVVEANDVDAIYEHMGSGALESELFDQLIILSQDQEVLHLFDATEQIAAPSQFDVASLQPFLAALANHEPSASCVRRRCWCGEWCARRDHDGMDHARLCRSITRRKPSDPGWNRSVR